MANKINKLHELFNAYFPSWVSSRHLGNKCPWGTNVMNPCSSISQYILSILSNPADAVVFSFFWYLVYVPLDSWSNIDGVLKTEGHGGRSSRGHCRCRSAVRAHAYKIINWPAAAVQLGVHSISKQSMLILMMIYYSILIILPWCQAASRLSDFISPCLTQFLFLLPPLTRYGCWAVPLLAVPRQT